MLGLVRIGIGVAGILAAHGNQDIIRVEHRDGPRTPGDYSGLSPIANPLSLTGNTFIDPNEGVGLLVSPELSRSDILDQIKQGALSLDRLADHFRDDEEIVLAAVQKAAFSITDASERLQVAWGSYLIGSTQLPNY